MGVGSLSFSSIVISSWSCYRHCHSSSLVRTDAVVAILVVLFHGVAGCIYSGQMSPLCRAYTSALVTKRKIKDKWAYLVCPLSIPPSFLLCRVVGSSWCGNTLILIKLLYYLLLLYYKPFNYLYTVYLLYTRLQLREPIHKRKRIRNKPYKTVS